MMVPFLKEKIMNNALKTVKKIDEIYKRYPDNKKMDIKDLEDLRRLTEILDNLTSSLTKNLY